ncbi:MAG: sulfite exporter TauE/SafE family protein [Gemmatimonadaceae bacterium]
MTLPVAILVAVLAGAVNSIAGGGTLLTFPALVALGVPPIVANATSAVGLWPGLAASMWGYRSELAGTQTWAVRFAVPSAIGGLAGALLLINTPPDRFESIVPWLVLGGTVLFMAHGAVLRTVARRGASAGGLSEGLSEALLSADGAAAAPVVRAKPVADAPDSEDADAASRSSPGVVILLAQLVIAVYGGYFGAGIGILMLSALGLMGLTNIHRMNGLKNWGGLCVNAAAVATFAVRGGGIVEWPLAVGMAAGAICGGYAGSRVARRVGQTPVRRAIVAIGLASGVWLFFAL